MDGFTASPANRHRPAKSEEPLATRCSLKCMKQPGKARLYGITCMKQPGKARLYCAKRYPGCTQNSRLSINRVLPMRAAIRATRLPSSLSAGSDRSGLRTTA
jgi:hypothetical protein